MTHRLATLIATTLAGLVVLAGCGGADSTADSVAVEATSPTTSEAPATTEPTTDPPTTTAAPTTTIDELERNRTVNVYIDAAAVNAACTNFDCITAQATFDRYTALRDMAEQIPGDDIDALRTSVSRSFQGWVDCLDAAATRMDCFDDEEATLAAINDLYNSLR